MSSLRNRQSHLFNVQHIEQASTQDVKLLRAAKEKQLKKNFLKKKQ